MDTILRECKSSHCECYGVDRLHCDAKLTDAARSEVACLIRDQRHDMENDVVFCSYSDALLMEHDVDHVGVHFADDRPEVNRILDAEGFDHTTGCDTAADSSHEGAMLCAGFAMMEQY